MTFTQNTSRGVGASLNRCKFPRSFASDPCRSSIVTHAKKSGKLETE
jgi:hypothetical protein